MSAAGEHRDALADGPVRGRGAGLSPGNRFDDRGGGGVRLHVLGDRLDAVRREHPNGVQVPTRTLADETRRVLNRVDSPDLPFHWTLNPYRGCEHGCSYCYARPTHETLGLSCGLDFESVIVVKHGAPGLLRRELAAPRWKAEPVVMSGATDPYQPLERSLGVTRGCLAVMSECGQPVTVVTKSRLVVRDLDLLAPLAARGAAQVAISVTTLDPALSRSMEPRASAPDDRIRAIRELSDAGIPVRAMIAPVVPGLTDHEVPALLEAVAGAGATSAQWILLRLPHQVKDLFLEWLTRCAPGRARRVEAAIRDAHEGLLYQSRYGARGRGHGPRAAQIAQVFDVFAQRHGLDADAPSLSSASFRRPYAPGQMGLFEDT